MARDEHLAALLPGEVLHGSAGLPRLAAASDFFICDTHPFA